MTSPQRPAGEVLDQLLSAASRLHGPSWREQLAGARALAQLADRWYSDGARAEAQRCIDVLCAYLRVHRYPGSAEREKSESAVREQITFLLMEFLRSGLGELQGGLVLNLSAVRIRGRLEFDGVSFGPGLRLIMDRAQLEEDSRLSFDGCEFRGCIIRLDRISLQKHAVLSLVGSTVDAGAWLVASTDGVHPTARVDVRGISRTRNSAPPTGQVASTAPLHCPESSLLFRFDPTVQEGLPC